MHLWRDREHVASGPVNSEPASENIEGIRTGKRCHRRSSNLLLPGQERDGSIQIHGEKFMMLAGRLNISIFSPQSLNLGPCNNRKTQAGKAYVNRNSK